MNKRITCPKCEGTGRTSDRPGGLGACDRCGGVGRVINRPQTVIDHVKRKAWANFRDQAGR